MAAALRTSPLDARHRALGARMVEFGGWEMPIQYRGVLEEHRSCREEAVVFDVSHLGSVSVSGAGSLDGLQWAFTNDLGRIEPGRAQYTHLLDPHDAHVVDDIIVWWVSDDEFSVMPNASNTAPLVAALHDAVGKVGSAATVEDITGTRALLAVQGPDARARVAKVSTEAAEVGRFRVARVTWEGVECLVAGTGYTGEDGIEIHVPAAAATALWDALLDAGVTPAGLGARDTLRLEMGYPLHGHELGEGITPWQANLGWVVRLDKGDFIGRDALVEEKEHGVARHLIGIALEGRQVPRAGYPILAGGAPIGAVTSGNFSPSLGHGIALGFVGEQLAPGEPVAIEVRGKPVSGTVVKPPFVKAGAR